MQRSDFLLVVSDEDIYPSREFQVPIQPRARVETVQERPESWCWRSSRVRDDDEPDARRGGPVDEGRKLCWEESDLLSIEL